ncbi:MAG: hypothetical protein K2Q01_02505, partial [Rickettsiales bacterium]|nr:hypothetical protein [Rickettsiales bacterium]
KLNYLIGFGHMESYPANMAFVELANKSKDMKDVKEAAQLLKSGQDVHAVFQQYGIDTHSFAYKPEATPEAGTTKFADKVPRKADLLSHGPKGHQDFAEQLTMNNLLS